MCLLRSFIIPKALNFFLPKTFNNLSSQMTNCLFDGSIKLLSLKYFHIPLTTSERGHLSFPNIAASSFDKQQSLANADFF